MSWLADQGPSTISPIAAKVNREWVEHALSTIKAAGYQKSDARREVVEAFARHDCAVTALDLEREMRARKSPVARATVYRVLEQLAELELAHRVDVGLGLASFEPVMPSGEHHHHIVCRSCGRIDPFEDPGLERAVTRVSAESRFAISDHEIILRGLCPRCS
jgi:Fur family ferric uptake transcriptional regulator